VQRLLESDMTLDSKSADCVFCRIDPEKILVANDLAFAVRDVAPVTHLRSLILPKRHVASFFDLNEAEVKNIERLVRLLGDDIRARDAQVEGFNIGINIGEVAGQTIFHCHYHLIPRRRGDVADPTGGVRWVIPSQGRKGQSS
jgi:ATP adenylyltransferase